MINQILAKQTKGQPEATVGMGATILMHSDRHAATIVDVFTKYGRLHVKVQRDKATRTDSNGMSDSQDYTFERDPQGRIEQVIDPRKRVLIFYGNLIQGPVIYTHPLAAIFLSHEQHWGSPR